MKDSVAVLLAACLLAAPAFGQVHSLPSTLTLDQTQDAIDWGMGKLKVDGKELNGNQQYQIADYRYDAGALPQGGARRSGGKAGGQTIRARGCDRSARRSPLPRGDISV
jgi:hypothetical protein